MKIDKISIRDFDYKEKTWLLKQLNSFKKFKVICYITEILDKNPSASFSSIDVITATETSGEWTRQMLGLLEKYGFLTSVGSSPKMYVAVKNNKKPKLLHYIDYIKQAYVKYKERFEEKKNSLEEFEV